MKFHVFIFLFYNLLFSSFSNVVCMDLFFTIVDEIIVGIQSCFNIELNNKIVLALLHLLNSTVN